MSGLISIILQVIIVLNFISIMFLLGEKISLIQNSYKKSIFSRMTGLMGGALFINSILLMVSMLIAFNMKLYSIAIIFLLTIIMPFILSPLSTPKNARMLTNFHILSIIVCLIMNIYLFTAQ